MDPKQIIEEYNARERSVENYREVALLLLIVSVIVLVLHAINRTRIGLWGGAMLAAGLVLLVLSLALGLLSFLRRRCPNCSRVLIGVREAAFCPECGATLKAERRMGMAPAPSQGSRRKASAKRGIVRREGGSRSIVSAADEYPEEAYPKNIRLFTTPDETVLTRRYIRLIDRDNRRHREGEDIFANPPSGKRSRVSRRPTGGTAPDRPAVGRGDSNFLSRLWKKVRPE
jgi:hypothetical protein